MFGWMRQRNRNTTDVRMCALCRETPIRLQYLLDFGLVLKQDLEQGSRKGRVGQQWDGRGCTKKAWT